MPAGFVEGPLFLQQIIAEAKVGIEPHFRTRIALDYRPPNLLRLLRLVSFKSGVTGIEQFFRGAILDNGAPCGRSSGFLGGKNSGNKKCENEPTGLVG